MLSLSSLIEFLLDMLRDEATKAEFDRDPNATLAARGLADVTAQDIRDVQPMLADVGGVHRVVHNRGDHDGGDHAVALHGGGGGGHGGPGHGGAGHGSGAHDAVREIHHVTQGYTVVRPVTEVTQEYRTYNSFTEFSSDHSVHAAEGSTVIQDSFNQDNDGVDNKGGTIDDSTVGGRDVVDSANDTETTTVEGSGNESVDVDDSGNTTAPLDPADVEHSGPDSGGDEDGGDDGGHASITYGEFYGSSGGDSYAGDTVNDSYAVDTPAAAGPAEPEPVGAESS